MPRILITITDEMSDALKQESEKRQAPVAALIREAITEWAEKRDIEFDSSVIWGGYRMPKKDDTEEGQVRALATA